MFAVHADVTDPAGETRAADRQVQVGMAALAASLTIGEWQVDDRPVAITARATSLDGEPRPARATLVVSRLRQPDQVVRSGDEPGGTWRTDVDDIDSAIEEDDEPQQIASTAISSVSS